MAVTWTVAERTPGLVRLVADGAALLILPAARDPELADVIAQYAPHLAFGPLEDGRRVARSGNERIVVGAIGAAAYLLVTRADIEVDLSHLVNAYVETSSPFDYLVS